MYSIPKHCYIAMKSMWEAINEIETGLTGLPINEYDSFANLILWLFKEELRRNTDATHPP